MAKVDRLRRRAEFLRVAAARRKWVTPGLILQAMPSEAAASAAGGAAALRVGFTVSRKVGGSVERNRARRRLKAAAAIMALEAAPGHDYVVIGRAATLRRPFAALVGDLAAALGGLGLRQGRADEAKREKGLP